MTILIENMEVAQIAEVLGDGNSRKILVAVHRKSKTASELASGLGIPIAVCYRRIKLLRNLALIQREEQVLTQNGKRRWAYISNIHRIDMEFREGEMFLSYMLRSGYSTGAEEVRL